MSAVKIGTGLPMAIEPREPGVPTIAGAARDIEAAGLESVWMPDLVTGDGMPTLEAALTLATAAAVTEQVAIGFSVLVVPLRPAPWLATQVATLQHLSGNRLILGVGSGGFPQAPFWQALGVSARSRGRLTDATLELLPRLMSGQPVEYTESEPAVTLTQAPAAPMPPVLVGGSERAFGRVLDHADGWFPSLTAPADLAGPVRRLRERAEERGLARPEVTVGGHLIMMAKEDGPSAYDAFVTNLVDVHHMPPETAARVPMVARTPAELAEIFAAYEDAGADRVVAGSDNGAWAEQLDFIAEARAQLG
ncbi:LLM class flavin-dependent oxidoreductase [Phytoactinopolyspora endophytica]|uniref:LLM class flavin-dependent oxidoreductase n=1 Tax=Phytoactinopolyspora endophytica TaxID=1642495 RepID=UPI00101C45C2|nr:LLM class flavin-dependent oxidoreductase [Phytoactinopolyspora endophytica]